MRPGDPHPRGGVVQRVLGPGGAEPAVRTGWRRAALLRPGDFALLDMAEAIVLPFDGKRSHTATRVYLKPYYLPPDLAIFEARAQGKL